MITGPVWSQKLRDEIGKAVIGQDAAIERLLVALLANGHVLLEGMPGLAKTLLVKSLGTALGVQCERVQFTPDQVAKILAEYGFEIKKTPAAAK